MRRVSGGLQGRLLVAFGVVAVIAIVLTASFTALSTTATVRGELAADLNTETFILEQIRIHGGTRGSWSGLQATVDELSTATGQRIAVTSTMGAVLADSDPSLPLPQIETAFVDPFDIALDVIEGFVVDADGNALISTGLTDALRAQAQQEADCLRDLGVDAAVGLDDLGLPIVTFDDRDGAARDLYLAECLSDLASFVGEDLEGLPPPALLYVGAGGDGTVELPGPLSPATMLLVALVVLIAMLAALLLSRRIATPLRQLTAAARRFAAGDRSIRVEVSGDDEVAQLAAAFNDLAASLESSEAARRRMVSDVAHELRNPLVSIRGSLEAAQDGVFELDERLVGSLLEDSLHLQRLVDDLQQLALADAGRLRIRAGTVELRQMVSAALTGLRTRAAADGLALEIGGEEVTVAGDAGRLRQVVANLVSNAIRHTERGGRLRVWTGEVDGAAVISVEDTGSGIAAEHLPHLFDRFYRVDASRSRQTGGTGLGLAIASEIVKAHGGRIEVRSAVGEGSVFIVWLPLPTATGVQA